jgi:hypothetical protein
MATTPTNDLAEHIGTILWIASGLLFICGVLITLIWNDFRKKVEEIKREANKFSEWLKKMGEEEGGLVTRELYFQWCRDQQTKCPACGGYQTLTQWRNGLMDKGGVMTKGEHTPLCKEITREVADSFCAKLDELFAHHREWVGQELKIISGQSKILLTLFKKQISEEDLKWEEHDADKRRDGR